MSAEDGKLVRCCLRGDKEAIRELVDRFQGTVLGLCVRLLVHRQDAEDVTQEVFLRVFRSLNQFDRTRPLRPWIVGITVNRCRTWMTQRARLPNLTAYLNDVIEERVPDDSVELQQEIQDALLRMRPEHREAFVLFHQQGLPYEEIAEAVDRPVGTVKTWLHRARLEVLEYLKERGMIFEESTR